VDAAAAHLGPTTHGPFHVDPVIYDANSAHFDVMALGDPEQIGVSGESGVEFTLDQMRTRDPDYGTCTQSFLRAKVLELLDLFYPAMEDALGDAWDDGAATTQQARALTALLSPLEIGTYEPFDHTLALDYALLRSAEADYSATPSQDGLVGVVRSDATLRASAAVIPPPTTWVYSAPGLEMFDDPADADPYGAVSPNALDLLGNAFDIAFGITTGMLNQVLRERSAAEWIRFEWRPTWEELGVTPPLTERPSDEATLDGSPC
jgi:hypothetical protein